MDEQAAEALGVSRSTLYRWRTGATRPSLHMRDALARARPGAEWGLPFESNTWVRAARRELGLGQTDFANICGVSQSIVSKWENGGLVLARESASELHAELSLPDSLDPASPETCLTNEECARRYAEHTSSLIIQSGPDADWRAAQLCSSISSQASHSVEAGRILAAAYANRSLWHLVLQNNREAARHATTAIKLGKRHGFNVESGYAFWSLARTRFVPGFGSAADVTLLDREVKLVASGLPGVPKAYARLLRGARAMAIGNGEGCANEFARAQEQAPQEERSGIVGRWGEDYWRRDITIYHAMLALCSSRFAECSRVIEPLAEEPFDPTVARQYGQSVARHYFQAAQARLGCRERIETDGPLLPSRILDVVKRHTARLSGYRFYPAP